MFKPRQFCIVLVGTLVGLTISSASAAPVTLEDLAEQFQQLADENRALRERLEQLETDVADNAVRATDAHLAATQGETGRSARKGGFVQFNHEQTYTMLDPTTRQNRKQELLLEARRDGRMDTNAVVLGGAITAIADYQHSDTNSKFGYLMRHPTPSNQIGHNVSEAALHSVQVSVTATLGSWLTGYAELLYDPEQSFGSGTITSLGRNQVQLRRGFVMFGDLNRTPFHAAIGKMATPFGLTDTLNPFTASTVWHAFGGLAYGVRAGYLGERLSITAMGIQGGAQFRASNTPVGNTAVPSKLNNFAIDASYTLPLGTDRRDLLLGGSYQHGSAYCQGFPIVHFTPCANNNPAWGLYSRLRWEQFTLQGEYAATTDEWPGTFNPTPPLDVFGAKKVESFDVGARYGFEWFSRQLYISFDFSRFIAGPEGAPWENQDQWVFGVAGFVTPSAKLFLEYVHVSGFAPLNFLSGGTPGFAPGTTISEHGVDSDVVLIGVNAAF